MKAAVAALLLASTTDALVISASPARGVLSASVAHARPSSAVIAARYTPVLMTASQSEQSESPRRPSVSQQGVSAALATVGRSLGEMVSQTLTSVVTTSVVTELIDDRRRPWQEFTGYLEKRREAARRLANFFYAWSAVLSEELATLRPRAARV